MKAGLRTGASARAFGSPPGRRMHLSPLPERRAIVETAMRMAKRGGLLIAAAVGGAVGGYLAVLIGLTALTLAWNVLGLLDRLRKPGLHLRWMADVQRNP
jgi:hypothetical protein